MVYASRRLSHCPTLHTAAGKIWRYQGRKTRSDRTAPWSRKKISNQIEVKTQHRYTQEISPELQSHETPAGARVNWMAIIHVVYNSRVYKQLQANISQTVVGQHFTNSCRPTFHKQLQANISQSVVGQHFTISCRPTFHNQLQANIFLE